MLDKNLNFRHLIKTFVPGLFTSISIVLFLDFLATVLINNDIHIAINNYVENNNTLIVALLIPVALFIGIVINTVCFIYLIPFIIKRHTTRNQKFKDFTIYRDSIKDYIRKYYYKNLFKGKDIVSKEQFENYFEVNSFLLHKTNMSNLQYIKTGYWYYLEFQLNSIISIVLGYIAINVNVLFRDINKDFNCSDKIVILVISTIIAILLILLLYKAIIRNLVVRS